MKILQLGDGRWGQNHKRILRELGHEVYTFDIEYDFKELIANRLPEAVVITTSSVNHWPITDYCLEREIPVFCEKPALLKPMQLENLKELHRRKPDLVYMAGHQLVFMEEITRWKLCTPGHVIYMNSMRNGAIPREEGALFSLMVHDIALAFSICNLPELDCLEAEGNKHELRATLTHEDFRCDLHAVSVSKVRMRHTTFIKNTGKQLSIMPDNFNRVDLLYTELEQFCRHAERWIPYNYNGISETIRVMETVFKIQKLMEEKKNETVTKMG